MVSSVPQITTQPTVVHPWMLARPVEDAAKLERKAKMYNILSKISLVAVAAIAISVLAVSLATSAATGALPFILLGLVLVTPCFAIAAQKFQDKGQICEIELETIRPTAQHFQQIKNWQETDILAFLEKHQIAAPKEIPLSRLLPLIARFMAKNRQAEESKERSDQLLQVADIPDRKIRLDSRCLGWKILEEQAIPSALEAAFILHILSLPYLQFLPSDVYACIPKPFEERQFDRLYDSDDAYLVLKNQDNQRVATLDDLRKNLSADRLYDSLFARS